MTPHGACCPDLYYPNLGTPGALRCDAVIVVPSFAESAEAKSVGADRMRRAHGLPHLGGDHADEATELEARTLGALGEILAGRVLGLPFDPKPFGRDIGPYEVRTAGSFYYECPIRRHDLYANASVPYVFATAHRSGEVAILRGWITPTEAAGHPEWEAVHGVYGKPAWYVPQEALHDLRRLRP